MNKKLKLLCVLSLITNSTAYSANSVTTMAEIARLPKYCRNTMFLREISGDTVPFQRRIEEFGPTFFHMHHYCWALDEEYKGQFKVALGDTNYVLNNNKDPNFFLLPEIYTTKARILFRLREDKAAAKALEKAIDCKPDYVPAITRLSDYYAEIGVTAKAIEILQSGLAHAPNSTSLQQRLTELTNKTDSETTDTTTRNEEIKTQPTPAFQQ
jgi:predicted Zn-dependent protease